MKNALSAEAHKLAPVAKMLVAKGLAFVKKREHSHAQGRFFAISRHEVIIFKKF